MAGGLSLPLELVPTLSLILLLLAYLGGELWVLGLPRRKRQHRVAVMENFTVSPLTAPYTTSFCPLALMRSMTGVSARCAVVGGIKLLPELGMWSDIVRATLLGSVAATADKAVIVYPGRLDFISALTLGDK